MSTKSPQELIAYYEAKAKECKHPSAIDFFTRKAQYWKDFLVSNETMQEMFLSGRAFYNHVRGSKDRYFRFEAGRLRASDFTGLTPPMVVESTNEHGATVSNVYWMEPQYIKFSELTFI